MPLHRIQELDKVVPTAYYFGVSETVRLVSVTNLTTVIVLRTDYEIVDLRSAREPTHPRFNHATASYDVLVKDQLSNGVETVEVV